MRAFWWLLDTACAVVSARRKLFSHGPGDLDAVAWAMDWTAAAPPAPVLPRLHGLEWGGGWRRVRGTFPSPLAAHLPERCGVAAFELLEPEGPPSAPVCVVLAATGDEGFALRRRLAAAPLRRRGIATVLLENPYYGSRRPPGQRGAAVATVADLVLLGRATVEEARALLAWLRSRGHRTVGVTGVSMGGQLAATAAATMPAEVAVAPCIPSRSPAPVFTRGALRRMVDWAALRRAWGEDAPDRLRALLETADVCALPPPRRPDCAVVVGARYDACVPPGAAEAIHRHWPGSELRTVPAGHAGAVAFHGASLARAAADAVGRLAAGSGSFVRPSPG